MNEGVPRSIAIGLLVNEGRVLVTEATEPGTGRVFVRPPGGGIEPGESAREALEREWREELDAQVLQAIPIGERQYRVTFAGVTRHEHAHVFAVTVATIPRREATLDAGHRVRWRTAEALRDVVAVPDDLAELITVAEAHARS